MTRKIDYSKIKAMASSILECIGEDEEGENPKIPGPETKPDPKPTESGESEDSDGGQSPNLDFIGGEEDVEMKKKKSSKEASLAMYGASLASKFKK